MSVNYEERAQQGLNMINNKLKDFGINPRYLNYKDFYISLGFKNHEQAYTFIFNNVKELVKGIQQKKEIPAEIIKNFGTIKTDNLNLKSDFLSNKMSNKQDLRNQLKNIYEQEKTQREAKKKQLEKNRKDLITLRHDNFPYLSNITRTGINVSRHPDYLRKDYFDEIVSKQHPKWRRYDDKDIDGDQMNDIAIYTDERNDEDLYQNLKYMNGYTLGNGLTQRDYKNYLLNNPNTTYKAFKKATRTTKPAKKAVIDVNETFNEFVKDINAALKGKLSQQASLYKTKYNFKQNLLNMIKAFIILPYGLIKLDKPMEKINQYLSTLVANKPSYDEFKEVSNTLKTKAFKDKWKELGGNIVLDVINNIKQSIINLINSNPNTFFTSVCNWNSAIPKIFYDKAIELAQKTPSTNIDLSENNDE